MKESGGTLIFSSSEVSHLIFIHLLYKAKYNGQVHEGPFQRKVIIGCLNLDLKDKKYLSLIFESFVHYYPCAFYLAIFELKLMGKCLNLLLSKSFGLELFIFCHLIILIFLVDEIINVSVCMVIHVCDKCMPYYHSLIRTSVVLAF